MEYFTIKLGTTIDFVASATFYEVSSKAKEKWEMNSIKFMKLS